MMKVIKIICWCVDPPEESSKPEDEEVEANDNPSDNNAYTTSIKIPAETSNVEQPHEIQTLSRVRFVEDENMRPSVDYIQLSPRFGDKAHTLSFDKQDAPHGEDDEKLKDKKKHHRKRHKKRRHGKRDK